MRKASASEAAPTISEVGTTPARHASTAKTNTDEPLMRVRSRSKKAAAAAGSLTSIGYRVRSSIPSWSPDPEVGQREPLGALDQVLQRVQVGGGGWLPGNGGERRPVAGGELETDVSLMARFCTPALQVLGERDRNPRLAWVSAQLTGRAR